MIDLLAELLGLICGIILAYLPEAIALIVIICLTITLLKK